MADFDPNTLCGCGCGQAIGPWAPPAKHANRQPPRFIPGHNCRLIRTKTINTVSPPPPNPSGICMCGCGKPVPRAKTDRGANQVAGEYLRYLRGHWPIWETRRNPPSPDDPSGPNPSGICQCGCGQRVGVADRTDYGRHMLAGRYLRFIRGHQSQQKPYPTHDPNPTGKCLCGCGKTTYIAKRSVGDRVKGCRNRSCVNPDHLEMVTHKENMWRTLWETAIPWWGSKIQVRKDPITGCWNFPVVQDDGYARVWKNGYLLMAHTLFYECEKGPIPQGLELDHKCRNRACVNPDHLEPVTRLENSQRAARRKADRS